MKTVSCSPGTAAFMAGSGALLAALLHTGVREQALLAQRKPPDLLMVVLIGAVAGGVGSSLLATRSERRARRGVALARYKERRKR